MQSKNEIGRMLGALHRNARNYFHHEFSRIGFGGGSHAFLMVLYKQDGVSQNELSTILNFDKAHATRAIQKLMQLGYITRERDEKDHRVYRIYLTEKARAKQEEIQKVLGNWTDIIAADLSAEEIEIFTTLLSKMTVNAREFLKQGKC
jgi:DNA-binding MarR family transcriptional regulator